MTCFHCPSVLEISSYYFHDDRKGGGVGRSKDITTWLPTRATRTDCGEPTKS